MRAIIQDLRYAVRQLCKSPGFTLAAFITLTIGIGANAAIFSSMDAVVLHPLTVPQLDRVITVSEHGRRETAGYLRAALANYQDWTRQSHSFEQLAVLTSADQSLTGAGDAAHVRTAMNSASFFSVLGVQPFLGRLFQPSENQPGKDSVALLNYGFWQTKFAGDPNVLGRQVQLDQRTYTIVGVLPKTVQYPSEVDFFVPFAPTPKQLANRADHDYLVLGRLRDGVTIAQAQDEMQRIAQRLSSAYPATNADLTVKVEPLLEVINDEYTPLYYRMIMGATLFVLVVVCANVANLQFARGIARRPEIAMRTALGASHTRVVRQLLTENILLGLLGAAGGLIFAWFSLRFTNLFMPPQVARYLAGWSNISLNGRVLVFSLCLALGAGVIAGVMPALEALRLNVVDQLKSGSRGTVGSRRNRYLRNIFAVAQIALAVALVIGGALISKGMTQLLHVADVYHPEKFLTFSVTLPANRYGTPQQREAWYRESLEKLRALPGVKHAEVSSAMPYSDQEWVQDTEIENRPAAPGQLQSAMRMPVSEGYFDSLDIPIFSGRGFNHGDTLVTVPVAVVSRSFVDRYFPKENPIGHRIRIGSRDTQTPWLTIVGVSAEVHYSVWDQTELPAVYMSATQVPPTAINYSLSTDGDPLSLATPARTALATLDPSLPLDRVETYHAVLHDSLIGLMYASAMMVIDALIALLLAAVGIFGVMANQVGERTREIGVRLALGARREDVLGMVLGRASLLTGLGLAIGLPTAYALARLVSNLLRGVQPDDPAVFLGIPLTIAFIAMAASWLPARRAARIDPMVALRND